VTARTEQKADPALRVRRTEKAKRVKRKRNIIIAGQPEVPRTADDVTVSNFCEDNLTIEPRPGHFRRVDCDAIGNLPKKLKISLDAEDYPGQ